MSATPSYLLVDGHNVMHAWPDLSKLARSGGRRHLARTELLKRLRHYQDMTGTQVVVVFDGTTGQINEEREKDGLQVIYADAGHTADDLLEKLAAKYAQERTMTVVTADSLLQDTIMAFGAHWMSPEMFRRSCEEAEQDMRGQMDKLHSRRQMLTWLGLLGAGSALPACASAPKTTPLTAEAIEGACRYAAGKKTTSLLIMQHGRVLHEGYTNGGSRKTPHRIFSGTKAFWGMAALAAVEDDLLSLEEPVSEVLPEWRADSRRRQVLTRHLLDFTAGLERGLTIHEDGLKDRNQMALKRPLLAAPGSRFIYGPSQLQVLHEVLKRKLAGHWRHESPTRYLERRVLRPLGLGPQRYLPDAAGHPLLAAGFMMTARQWSRLGECLLHGGSPVLKPESFALLLSGSQANPAYHSGIWNNRQATHQDAREIDIEEMLERDWDTQSWRHACLLQDQVPDLLACIGSGYQRLFAIPSRQLLIIRQGQNASFSDAAFLRHLLGKA